MDPTVQFLAKHQKHLIRFAQTLVQIPSENGNETEVAKAIKYELGQYGIESKLIGKKADRKTLLADIGRGSNSVMLNGHLDVVPAGNHDLWTMPPFGGKTKNGKLYGRGACDMKCSVACMTYSAIALHKTKTLPGKIRLVFNYDEESGKFSGIREVVSRGIGADAIIIGEPMSGGAIRIGAKGIYRFELITHGKSAHTGYLPGGINAVTAMAKLLVALEKFTPYSKKHALFSKSFIVPGTIIAGGTAINACPARCTAHVDCRLGLGQTEARIKREIRRCLNREVRKSKKIRYSIKELSFAPPFLSDRKADIIKAARNAFKQITRKTPKVAAMQGASDGNIIGEDGCPCVIFGVEGGNIHTEDEYADMKSLLQIPTLYARTIENYFEALSL